MSRIANIVSVPAIVRILRLVNDLAPAVTGGVGDPMPVEEFASRLDMDVDEVVWYIEKINDGCGDSAPEMIVLYDPDERAVTPLRIESAFVRPLRLTPAEARGLVAAAQVAGYDVDDLIDKVYGAFPSMTGDRLADIRTTARQTEHRRALSTMTEAAREHLAVRISYTKPGDRARERVIEPLRIDYDAEAGTWYVVAWCRKSDGWRTFRIDRIGSVEKLDETFEPHDTAEGEPSTFSFSEAPDAVVAVHDPQAVSEAYDWRNLVRLSHPDPFDLGRLSDEEIEAGGYIARIPWVEGYPWLVDTILRTAGGVEVLRPVRLREEVRRRALELAEAVRQGAARRGV